MAMWIGSAEAVDMSPKASAITPTKTFSILINSSSRSVIDNTDVYMRKAALGSLLVALVFFHPGTHSNNAHVSEASAAIWPSYRAH